MPCYSLQLTRRAKPTVKPPTPRPATRGFVSTPNVPKTLKPARVYTAMAADLDANLQIHTMRSGQSQISQALFKSCALLCAVVEKASHHCMSSVPELHATCLCKPACSSLYPALQACLHAQALDQETRLATSSSLTTLVLKIALSMIAASEKRLPLLS